MTASLLLALQIVDCRPEVHLGFDSLQRSLITTIKEAVDNTLDACEGPEGGTVSIQSHVVTAI